MRYRLLTALFALTLLSPLAHASLVVVPWLSGTFTDHNYDIGGVSPDGKRGFDLKVIGGEPEMFNGFIRGTIFDRATLTVEQTFIGFATHIGGPDPEGDFDFAGRWNPTGLITIGSGLGDGDADDPGEPATMTITTFTPEPSSLLLMGSGLGLFLVRMFRRQ